MNKRTFLKLLSTLAATRAVSPLMTFAFDEKLHNWSGNVDYSTQKLVSADSIDQVRDFVKKQKDFKVLGTRHCFNRIADSKHQFLSLVPSADKPIDQLMSLDASAGTVTVVSGTKYGQFAPRLHEQGFALHNLASLPHISVAGAC